MMNATKPLETTVQRHPVSGAIYGLLIGASVAIYLVLFSVTPFRISTMVTVAVAGLIVGALWGAFAPATKPQGIPVTTTTYGSTFTRAEDFDGGPPESYEEAFGTATTEVRDDGSFGAPAPDGESD